MRQILSEAEDQLGGYIKRVIALGT